MFKEMSSHELTATPTEHASEVTQDQEHRLHRITSEKNHPKKEKCNTTSWGGGESDSLELPHCIIKKFSFRAGHPWLMPVNLSYLGGRDQKDCRSRPVQATQATPYLKKTQQKKGLVEWLKQ
jgi:hypothetical protein